MLRLFWLSAFSLNACVGGQSGTESDYTDVDCVDVGEVTDLDAEFETSLGTPAALAANVASERSSVLHLRQPGNSDVVTTQMTVSWEADLEEARLVVRRHYLSDDDQDVSQDGCSDQMLVPATMRFDTADGAFSERIPGELTFWGADATDPRIRFGGHRVPVDDLAGDYDAAWMRELPGDPVLSFHIEIAPELSGLISAIGEDMPDPSADRIPFDPLTDPPSAWPRAFFFARFGYIDPRDGIDF